MRVGDDCQLIKSGRESTQRQTPELSQLREMQVLSFFVGVGRFRPLIADDQLRFVPAFWFLRFWLRQIGMSVGHTLQVGMPIG